ncbi:hypothetical protein [Ureibacillus aquaedulcis]|uniref:Aminotransferase yhxA n=1 Tax=Ureibacillus aquaedulcis TaxID=3058421 RepID=A0ABT8GM90_9BACL|nr:hypothetical protein [Ureibacillus sp. BA0131]MDN4492547.1 hypothetical protein [Ureibacillus sp. BA0131]
MSKTKKMMVGVLGAAALVSLTACAEEEAYGAPTGTDCDDWEWDSTTDSYYCDDDDSIRAGHYFYGGHYYDSKKKLTGSSLYKSNTNTYSNSSSGSSTFKSGIGSGTKGGFGG